MFEARLWLPQVNDLESALRAEDAGAAGLIVKGNESGGIVGSESSFVLLQEVAHRSRIPIWLQGGIGIYTAPAAIMGGAYGVVVDSQLALLNEARRHPSLRSALRKLDGSETVVEGDERVLHLSVASKNEAVESRETQRVTAGQDVGFANALATRFGTVRDFVRGLLEAMTGHIREAKARPPLAPGSAFALEAGTRFPIAQGPMTRVSDRAAFVEAVAENGALPFVALSLMDGAQTRSLLSDVKDRLGAQSWGVGILGFAPADVRASQLEAIEEYRPAFVVIAGGRPSQARSLEQKGIRTFLHVPSPGLLDLYLRDGARRFVFEGNECGGHIGPRSSFTLWEQAAQRLSEHDDLREISVLFAGGIHDARSAAIVGALCAPLCAQGMKAGVVLGTAYLFTDEAVQSGAITGTFQHEAIHCERTALLETAPGHVTRAADTLYVQEFTRSRAQLEADQLERTAMWASLERLNLGRLRIASKGVERVNGRLEPLDASSQRQRGLFMLGQIARLRSATLSMRALHEEVSGRSSELLRSAEIPSWPAQGTLDEIAVVGMACVFPGATDLETFWLNVLRNRSCVTEVPAERLNQDLYYAPDGGPDRTRSKWGGFIPPIVFEPRDYGIPPRSVGSIDPGQLLALHVVSEALKDASMVHDAIDHERTAVIFGAEAGSTMTAAYVFRCTYPQLLGPLPPELDEHLPDLSEDSFPGVLANVIAGRVSNRLDLRGANYAVNAACASSLAALDVACKELLSGCADVAIAGAADLHNGTYDYLMFSSVQALSPTGTCKTFDQKADGIVLGEGLGAVVLKRMTDALRDGDRIYCVLRSVAGSSDGRSLGLTAPRRDGQRRALQRAYARANLSPADVGLIEAHGTGTVVGDRTELRSLSDLMAHAGASNASCTLGSVKSQIGHTKCAAGMAGLIKAALATYHGVLPPTAQLDTPSSFYDSSTSPFVFRNRAAPWFAGKRVAGISAFGFGGTNFHAVIEAASASKVATKAWPAELFVFRGVDSEDVRAQATAMLALLQRDTTPRLRDLAATIASAQDTSKRAQLAFVAEGIEPLREALSAFLAGTPAPVRAHMSLAQCVEPPGKIALLFPGQGSQRTNMGAELLVYLPRLGAALDRAHDIARKIFAGTEHLPERERLQRQALADTRHAQPSLACIELALIALLEDLGASADFAAGHSYGELVALAYAGAIDRSALVDLSRARASAITEAIGDDPGTMAAVEASAAQLTPLLRNHPQVVIANRNSPEQCVIAGPTAALQAAVNEIGQAGLRCHTLEVACAFHSPLMRGADVTFAKSLRDIEVTAPRLPVWSNVTGRRHADDPQRITAQLAQQLVSEVLFEEQILDMYAAGTRVFVEVGPGAVLTRLVRSTLQATPHVAISLGESSPTCDLHGVLGALGQLVTAGVHLDIARLFLGRDARLIDFMAVETRVSATAWRLEGHCARPMQGPIPSSALKPCPTPIKLASAPATQSGSELLEYLSNMRDLAEHQRDVMLRHLGSDPLPVRDRGAIRNARATAADSVADVASDGLPAVEPPSAPELLLDIISERTGYPKEMLEPGLSLEADLGIDSIKRTEIFGTFVNRLGLDSGTAHDGMIEELARLPRLCDLQAWLAAHELPGAPKTQNVAASPASPSSTPDVEVQRFVVALTDTQEPARGKQLSALRIALLPDDRGIASALAPMLIGVGLTVEVLGSLESLAGFDGAIVLEGFGDVATDKARKLFARLQTGTQRLRSLWAITARPNGSAAAGLSGGAGTAGLLRTLGRERTTMNIRLIELDPREAAETLARVLFAELQDSEGPVEIRYEAGKRRVPTLIPEALSASENALPLDGQSVVLVTGGARGITAQCALELARHCGCRLEIVGRTSKPIAAEDPRTAGASDIIELRKLLARDRDLTAREIGERCQRIFAERELRATFSALDEAGARYAYTSIDVRDDATLAAFVRELYARHGRIDGVLHGAGVIDDRLFEHKTLPAFDRVFDTKVKAAETLVQCLRPDVRFIAFFASISGVLGNSGQADYAAANDCLDELAGVLRVRLPHTRVCSIDWGPWSGGMVSAELARAYESRGIALIPPELGVRAFVHELMHGNREQVVLTASQGGRHAINLL
jgi:acyl transferase domain-containing protein/NAD(P)H-dependent flavin oxidoreductase YrpB (nitropropane dioxygenase family)/NAD(P)-dependent dehydrogenase (short-subunit alcohol dehydrogenase family)